MRNASRNIRAIFGEGSVPVGKVCPIRADGHPECGLECVRPESRRAEIKVRIAPDDVGAGQEQGESIIEFVGFVIEHLGNSAARGVTLRGEQAWRDMSVESEP